MGKKILEFIGQYAIALIGVFISSVLFWNFSPDDTISITTFMCFVIPLGLCVAVAIPQLIEYWTAENREVSFPKLKTIIDNVLIFEASTLFSTQCVVTLFYIDELERQIGYGFVETVKSDNHCLQVRVLGIQERFDEKFLHKNKSHILIKPNCPYELIQTNIQQNTLQENVNE